MTTLPYLRWRLRKVRKRVVRAVCSRIYLDRQRALEKNILFAGSGRSGTTWLAEEIASRLSGRIVFEPFATNYVEQIEALHYFQYLRPADSNETLLLFAGNLFSGNVRHRWIDKEVDRLLPRLRVIKDIRANLLLKWLRVNFPQVPIVLIARHPCAVVLSRMELNWATDTDIAPFLHQPDLIEDHLVDLMDVIGRAQTAEEKHAVIWCVTNFVPLRQFAGEELPVVFYEDLCAVPDEAFAAVFKSIGQLPSLSGLAGFGKASRTARPHSAVVRGEDAIRRWTKKLDRSQIDRVLKVVEAFGLDHLYGDSLMPLTARNLAQGLPTVRDLGGGPGADAAVHTSRAATADPNSFISLERTAPSQRPGTAT